MPLLRIHFLPDDLARTRPAVRADLSWETGLSLDLLRGPLALTATNAMLSHWRSWARKRLGPWALPLLAAAPSAREFPDFQEQVRRDGDDRLGELLDRFQATLITPVWPAINTAVDQDQARRTRTFMDNGLEGLLETLAPAFQWRAPVLQTEHPVERDLRLAGRGLLLVPSWFCGPRPIVRADRPGPVTLVHSITPATRILISPGGADRQPDGRAPGLDALLGSTRAAVLQTLASGCTTTELAQRVGISTASASQHASILREAGLISTQRQGPSVLHMVTALGSAVLTPS